MAGRVTAGFLGSASQPPPAGAHSGGQTFHVREFMRRSLASHLSAPDLDSAGTRSTNDETMRVFRPGLSISISGKSGFDLTRSLSFPSSEVRLIFVRFARFEA